MFLEFLATFGRPARKGLIPPLCFAMVGEYQNTMKNKETAVLLGARKASGLRCSNCKKYGYVEKSWIYCKCRKTKTCCLHCQEIFFPIHIKDCRKNLKELEDSKKRNSGNHSMKKEKNNDGTNCARDLKSTNTVVPSSFVNAI